MILCALNLIFGSRIIFGALRILSFSCAQVIIPSIRIIIFVFTNYYSICTDDYSVWSKSYFQVWGVCMYDSNVYFRL